MIESKNVLKTTKLDGNWVSFPTLTGLWLTLTNEPSQQLREKSVTSTQASSRPTMCRSTSVVNLTSVIFLRQRYGSLALRLELLRPRVPI